MVHGTVRRAQLTTMQQAFARAPVFCVNQRPLLQRLATHFELRVYERNETIVEEGKRVEFFCMVHQGSVATYKRAAWGVMQYAVSHGRTKAAEEYVETIGHDAGMPFFGEEALLAAPDYRGMGGQELGGDVAKVTVRAAERTCLFAMPREHAVAFLREFTQFGELMIQQRADSKRSSLRADAMNQAFAQAKAARSGARFEEVEEALERARAKDRRDAEEKRAKARGDPVKRPYVPKPKSPPHPHSPPRDRRGRVEDAARRTMFTGIEVHQVASRMGLVDEAKEETKSTFVGSTLRRASAEGGAAPAEEAPLTEEEKKALASQAFFSAVRKVKPSVYNPLVDGKRPEHWGPAGAAAPPG